MGFLNAVKSEAAQLRADCTQELMRNADRYKRTAQRSMAAGAVIGNIVPVMAAGSNTISGFGTKVQDVIEQIYSAVFPIMTIVAALLLVIAFIMRMTANQQKAQQATSWIVRIIVTYICVNCIALLFRVISNTTRTYRWSKGSAVSVT